MHAKTIVVDDAWTLIGSANMDERSMELNEENALGISDPGLAGAIAAGNEQDFARSREIHLEEWLRRPWYQRVLERAAEILLEQY
jgi:cardiolipin synthase